MKIDWLEEYMAEAERLIYENRIQEGIALLNGLLFHEPGYGPLHNHLGWAYLYYTADAEKSEEHLRWAMRFAPGYQAPYLHIGQLLIRVGRYAEAIQYLETGVGLPEANRVAFYESLGRAWEGRNEFRKARRAYRQAMLASSQAAEMSGLEESMTRCRKKAWITFFSG